MLRAETEIIALPFQPTALDLFSSGAHYWNRTNDLLLTKEVLYRLS